MLCLKDFFTKDAISYPHLCLWPLASGLCWFGGAPCTSPRGLELCLVCISASFTLSNHWPRVSAQCQAAKFLITAANSELELPFIYILLSYSGTIKMQRNLLLVLDTRWCSKKKKDSGPFLASH